MIRSPDLNRVPPRMRRGALRGLLALAMWLLCATAVAAHTMGENYVFVDVRDDRIDGRFEIHANDLKSTNSSAANAATSMPTRISIGVETVRDRVAGSRVTGSML